MPYFKRAREKSHAVPDKKVALVTGGGRRMGAAIASALHREGYMVAIHCNQSSVCAENLASDLNKKRKNSALVLKADLANKEETTTLIKSTINWAGQLDILVNNAALFLRSSPTKNHDEEWETLFTVNVRAPYWLSLAAYPFLVDTFGLIVNITDIHAEKPLKEYAVYCQTKAALVMQTKALAKEFAPNVRVNGIAPGAILWPENDNSLTLDVQNEIIFKTPLKRHGDSSFIAQAIISLANNSFVTGQIWAVDGGRSLC